MTITLAIDTAAPRLQLALTRGDGGVDISVDAIATGHAEIIFGRIGTLLGRNGLDYSDLERVVTTTGPGSFTGLRIGLAAARGIGLARDIAVVGVSSLVALSLLAPGDRTTLVLVDARRGEMYGQLFNGPGHAAEAPFLLSYEQAYERSRQAGGVLGTGAPLAAAAVGAADFELHRPEADRGFVDIAALARFGSSLDPSLHPPEPHYLRDADAKPQSAARIARLPS